MPFKVVQTIEKNKLQLTTVPDKWEQNGTLLWPKNKQERLRRQEECAPERTWSALNCIVKRSNLRTFEEGEAEIDAMSDKSETETDSELPRIKRLSRAHKNVLPLTAGKSFNEMAEEQVAKIYEPSFAAQEVTQAVNDIQHIDIDQQKISEPSVAAQEVIQEVNDIQHINIDQPYVILNQEPQIQQLQDDIKSIKQDLKTIMDNQSVLFEIQNNILLKTSEFQTQFEGYVKMTSTKPQRQDTTMKLIKNLNDLEDFEKKMSDVTTRAELFQKYHKVCSKSPGKGMSNAYFLVDEIFDRSFFNICSWTGSSKGDTQKVCFKAFSKTKQFFFDIVHDSDPSFTKANCDKFFKIIMKNSRSRCESNQRMSSSKQRLPRSKTLKTIHKNPGRNMKKNRPCLGDRFFFFIF